MKLITYREGSRFKVGLRVTEGVIDVWAAAALLGIEVPNFGAVEALLEIPNWRELAERVRDSYQTAHILPESIDIGPTVVRPRNIFVIAANTTSHLKEAGKLTNGNAPLKPVVLAKTPGALIGPYDPIVHPRQSTKVDYEAELGVVIGSTCRNVPEQDVHRVIAGYTVVNDVSARDYQLSEWEPNTFYRTHYLGKSFDGFCPCGPALVTPDEIANIESREVRCWVNDELRQNEPISGLYFSIAEVISFVSSVMTLFPGDLFLMGTPSGVGSFTDPPRYLKPGDTVRCEVQDIGVIENRIIEDDASIRIEKELEWV